ncbi:L-piperidine-6-carboxylate dehydrogenase [Geoalkalibacter halelectricus]|uniref:aldehyde dehydrogenase (NAD(+)) n=1 Tax=Geoalkalibacter halelectricus TaxID=2847045 RepID=A0ABY5ZTP6_9BACT|nr:aldehyde dehydrogenase family protein [Geoalkalibacter halelectricus]MDO3379885.1 aldehyde dehydrogenase family protein [Geoalkalibacter halelectricus]UWZ80586.1 aldehyde dehydrogenase family protein [Geoalkalibacter halelectricus]
MTTGREFLEELGIAALNPGASSGRQWPTSTSAGLLESISPADGQVIAKVRQASAADCDQIVQAAQQAFTQWRAVPAPQRGEVVRQIGLRLRERKQALGTLVSYEMGKSLQEGLGEVQEMIDICDFAVGQSRMLYGLSMHSERERHRMYEQYHPLGIVGIFTAFNFPVAVWSWNAMLAAVCGDVMIWKPSSKVPLSAIAVQKICAEVLRDNDLPEGIFNLLIGSGQEVGEALIQDRRLPLVSFTGSVPTGRHVAEVVARRLGKTILELSGNNAIILTEHADLKLALPAVVFGAVGTAGQRCTTTRRLIVHEALYDKVKKALMDAYHKLRIGHPLDEGNHVGPLIDRAAVAAFRAALARAREQGATLIYGGEVLEGQGYESGCYVVPALVEAPPYLPIIQQETFGPLLYLIPYTGELSQAVAIQNEVPQGLSSAIFTTDLREAETFLGTAGSDCGIANVNIGTSGAEIGGAFGGEKDTGGGREAGSDVWKAYMRRQTVTINYGSALPLAQGISFRIEE